jgi:hypothetical protein
MFYVVIEHRASIEGAGSRTLYDAPAYRTYRPIDLNLILSFIAFCATAPRDRRSFLPAWVAESLSLARLRRFFTSSVDHARITNFRFAIHCSLAKAHIISAETRAGHCFLESHGSRRAARGPENHSCNTICRMRKSTRNPATREYRYCGIKRFSTLVMRSNP